MSEFKVVQWFGYSMYIVINAGNGVRVRYVSTHGGNSNTNVRLTVVSDDIATARTMVWEEL